MSDYVQMYENPRFPHEKSEAERLAKNLRMEASYEGGIVRWRSNGHVVPSDCAAFAAHLGLPVDLDATTRTRHEEDAAFFEQYRRNYRPPTGEALAEMRAAFRPGETVVDAISGHRIKL